MIGVAGVAEALEAALERSTPAVTRAAESAHRNGVKAVTVRSDQNGVVGEYRFSPKITLNGCWTGVAIEIGAMNLALFLIVFLSPLGRAERVPGTSV